MSDQPEPIAVTPEGTNIYWWVCNSCHTLFNHNSAPPIVYVNAGAVARICEPCKEFNQGKACFHDCRGERQQAAGKAAYEANRGRGARIDPERVGRANARDLQPRRPPQRQRNDDAPWCPDCGENKVGRMRNGDYFDTCYTCSQERR